MPRGTVDRRLRGANVGSGANFTLRHDKGRESAEGSEGWESAVVGRESS